MTGSAAFRGFPLRALKLQYGIADDVLAAEGVKKLKRNETELVAVPYFDCQGRRVGERLLINVDRPLDGRWSGVAAVLPYGLQRLAASGESGRLLLVESELECLRLWSEGYAALSVQGPGTWGALQATDLPPNISEVFVLGSSEAIREAHLVIQALELAGRAHFVELELGILSLERGTDFRSWLDEALGGARSFDSVAADLRDATQTAAAGNCGDLLDRPSILDEFTQDLREIGVVGEERGAKLLYLALVSRITAKPVSIVVKASSSSGKSFLANNVLRFFPPNAYYALSGMSERALAYSTEPLVHRFLVIAEAAGAQGDFQSYLLRTLLSEGRIAYETVMDRGQGLESFRIEREGPTGLLITTTSISLHPENETRLLSLPVDESPEQTRAVIREIAREDRHEVDLSRWHALQDWLAAGWTEVTIPFSNELAELVDVRALRVRRDVTAVLSLIKASALLHQRRRAVADGQVVAELEDYAVVYDLVADLMAEGLEATVPPGVRAVVDAVEQLTGKGDLFGEPSSASNTQIVEYLSLDKSTISRRVAEAVDRGFLRDLEDGRRSREKRLVCDQAMPGDVGVLPTPDELLVAWLPRVDRGPLRASAERRSEQVSPSAQAVAGHVQ